jgi:hypothetical protein
LGVRAALVTLAAASVLLAGCAPEPMPVPTPTYTSTYVAPPPVSLAPLTGEVVAAPITTPALSAKVDNHPDARPQFGLERTDIVFEELVEGGLTRYVAIWQSDVPEEIGPVRSIRPMDPDIISPFGGIVAYSGGQYRFVAAMEATGVYNAIHGQSDTEETFYRTDLKDSPHDVIVRAQQVIARHLDLPAPAQQFSYSLDVPSSTAALDGTPIAAVGLVIGGDATPSWGYDPTRLAYLRYMTGGEPDLDEAGGQLTATNLIVLRVDVTYDYDIPKTELISAGEAWVSSGGGTVHGTWSKGSPTERIRIVDDNGVPVRLAPGNTWIELVPLSGSADFVPPAPAA